MKNKAPIDYEIYPFADKSRRLFIEILEILFLGFVSLFLFSVVTSNIIRAIPSYKEEETRQLESTENLYKIGEESKLVYRYSKDSAADQYDMFVRYCYKQVHKSFELYPQDFADAYINEIEDRHNLSAISKENDELQYFFTEYAPSKNLITVANPLDNYRNNIFDSEKYGKLFVFNEEDQVFILNPTLDRGGSIENVGVILYRELRDNIENGAMKEVNKFYNEYYELANSMLETLPEYQEQYQLYESSSLAISKYISFGLTFNYLFVGLSYFLIMPLIRKDGTTFIRKYSHVVLTNEDGTYLKWYKKLAYYLIKTVLCFFSVGIPFYIGYGESFFTYPYHVFEHFIFAPLLVLLITFALALINSIAIYLPTLNQNKTTLIEHMLSIRTADARMDMEGGKHEKK